MTRMFNPPHPGEWLREDVLPELGITVTEAASQLGVTRATFSRIINGRAGISPDMALRLAAWLGGTPESWLNMQTAYDLWQAQQKPRPQIPAARSVHA
ncbi:MAG: HigA family addiction module antitoxin [Mariprofundaceae bacterium]